MKRQAIVSLLFLACAACSSAPDEPEATSPAAPATAQVSLRLPGYVHRREASKFWLGALVSEETTPEGKRFTGSDGVLTVWRNGLTVGVPNADAASKAVEPFADRPEPHNERVRAYFVDGGLPADQIGPVHANASIRMSGTTADGEVERKLIGYTTVVDRIVDGVRVEGSYAWARFNKNGDVVAERVWWPELPASVREDIAALKATLADPDEGSRIRGQLPDELADEAGEIVVHHPPPTEGEVHVAVSVDFAARGRPAPLRFDRHGAAVADEPIVAAPGVLDAVAK